MKTKFSTNSRCSKCGSTACRYVYNPNTDRMDRICECGYRWSELPLDHDSPTQQVRVEVGEVLGISGGLLALKFSHPAGMEVSCYDDAFARAGYQSRIEKVRVDLHVRVPEPPHGKKLKLVVIEE